MQRFKNILCVVAADCVNGPALERAAALASTNKARLTVVEVIDEIPPETKLLDRALFSEIKANIFQAHQKALIDLVAPWEDYVSIDAKVLVGIPFLEVTREVLRNGRDLVIKATENDGFLDRVFGSYDMHLSRKCPCPVWLVNSKSTTACRRIVAAVDVDDCYRLEEMDTRRNLNLQILETASSLARSECAELHIVHACNAAGEKLIRVGFVDKPEDKITLYLKGMRLRNKKNLEALMDAAIATLGQQALEGISLKTHLVEGSPRKEIPAFVNEIKADLVVMGTVARTGIPGFFMGNTAEEIHNHINCSVLAIKPQGFVTPVTIED